MKYAVLIIRNSDNFVRIRVMDVEWDYGSHYWWTEGNFGCDCNRSLSFYRATGCEIDIDDVVCGHEAYSVPVAVTEDKQVHEIDGWGDNGPSEMLLLMMQKALAQEPNKG